MTKKLFGTDGIRGVANTELSPELAFKLGRAVVATLPESAGVDALPRVLIGRDTRRSGEMLEGALVAGITSAGADAVLAGIVPTPAVALLLKDGAYDAGIVISASHNPPEYNGLKVFSGDGYKLSDEQEAGIEALLHTDDVPLPEGHDDRPVGCKVGRAYPLADAVEHYVHELVALFEPNSLKGLRVVLDCGHGASVITSPAAFRALGAQVTAINEDFSGDDINVCCGSTHLDVVGECVQSGNYDLGIAHDGDADRMLAVDEHGEVIDGDHIIVMCAKCLRDEGLLPDAPVVTTVMANLGFNRALEELGLAIETTQVGDRYVLERMRQTGAILGGEQSGHVIFLRHNTTGDGLLSALMLAHLVAASDKTASELAKVMTSYPQVLRNVTVKDKDIAGNAELQAAIAAAEEELADTGRVLVRASGTEPLVRVMVEAADAAQAEAVAEKLVVAVASQLGYTE